MYAYFEGLHFENYSLTPPAVYLKEFQNFFFRLCVISNLQFWNSDKLILKLMHQIPVLHSGYPAGKKLHMISQARLIPGELLILNHTRRNWSSWDYRVAGMILSKVFIWGGTKYLKCIPNIFIKRMKALFRNSEKFSRRKFELRKLLTVNNMLSINKVQQTIWDYSNKH